MTEPSDPRYLTTAEVARRLDVKPETVYAYVSRGMLTSVRAQGRRGSLFAQDDVDRLVERAHADHRPSGAVERIRTELTLLENDELYYRGRRVVDLAATHSVESVAHLLWTGELSDRPAFAASDERVALVRASLAALPPTARLTDRIRVAVAVLGAADPLRADLSPASIIRAAEAMLATLAEALSSTVDPGTTLAERLWPGLSTAPRQAELLNTVLVLLADHGLAVSTVAARVAASARAHVYAVVSAGLGAADGHYHGTASTLAYRFLAEARQDPLGALSERLRAGNPIPGYGHTVYQDADPRAQLLLSLLKGTDVMATVDLVSAELAGRSGLFPNVDLALAALMHAYDMRPDAGEAIFEFARTIGWIAHALEEYTEPSLRFRPLGVYTGTAPFTVG
ncbi:MAG: excisionase family binding protein [Amycolatopsis sp.]|uniref:citrate synthase n=1 Tax=Amycolatopsis sp. TaxID=37632 RepID=UPI00261A5B6F|nr:citrate synthase [Amycolatopsis sp.]MCU1681045.1 excisionase family binding protein [Amycolatopsis sp.]